MVRPRWSPCSTVPSISQGWPSSSDASLGPAGAQRLADAGRGVDLALVHHRVEHGDAERRARPPSSRSLSTLPLRRAPKVKS